MTEWKIINADCLDAMREMADNSIDFVVTDPPYGLHFMGKGWDKFKKSNFDEKSGHKLLENYGIDNRTQNIRKVYCANAVAGTYDENLNDEFQEFMRIVGIEMLRILKPGGHLAMFGAPRRHHRQMSGLEDAGFEIRDCIAWVFGQGFPKSHNFGKKIGGEWAAYGTALKPAYEPIIIAMKPLDGTFAQNAEKWGVAGINVDESRIPTTDKDYFRTDMDLNDTSNNSFKIPTHFKRSGSTPLGRWPANIIFDEEAAQELDEMTKDKVHSAGSKRNKNVQSNYEASSYHAPENRQMNRFGDSGGASRFFYCAKASRSERNKGLEGMPLKESEWINKGTYSEGRNPITGERSGNKPLPRVNNHPTVKPIALMKYIIKLLAPPSNPILLDPFAGSGSTIVAAKELGISAIGIEKEAEYAEIAQKRLDNTQTITINPINQEPENDLFTMQHSTGNTRSAA